MMLQYLAHDLIRDSMNEIKMLKDKYKNKNSTDRAKMWLEIKRIRSRTNVCISLYRRHIPRPMLDWWFELRDDEPSLTECAEWFQKHSRDTRFRPSHGFKVALKVLAIIAFITFICLGIIL